MRHLPWRIWVVILPLATGAGLVVYILAGLSLILGVGLAMLVGLIATLIVWRRSRPVDRQLIRQRAIIGLYAGALATLSYDVCRYVMVTVLHFTFWPFDIFSIFGRLLVGDNAPTAITTGVGILYHYANGIGFAIAFVFLFRRPGVLSGLVWAAMLEFFMVSLYPSWLNLKALDEFLSVSIVGHTIYGLVLGSVARYSVSKRRMAAHSTVPHTSDESIR